MGYKAGKVSLLTGVALTVALATAPSAFAEESAPPSEETLNQIMDLLQVQQQKLAEQQKKLDAQSKALVEQQRTLLKQQSQIEELEGRTGSLLDTPIKPAAFRWDGARGYVPAPRYTQDTASDAPQPVPPEPVAPSTQGEGSESDRPESEKPTELLLLDRGAVLLPQGRLQIEPSIDYTHTSSDRVAINGFTIFDAIVIGSIRVDELDRDIVTGAVTSRFGVTDRVQVEAYVPGIWRSDSEVLGVGTGTQTERSIDGYGLGDVETTVSWQPLIGEGALPDTIVRARARFPTGTHPFEIDRETVGPGGETRLADAPTGSGFYGVGPGATLVWRSDPVVYFTGGSYTFNLERDFDTFGTINPGNTLEWFAGLNIALSDSTSINMSFVDQITGSTEQDGSTIAGSNTNDGRLVLGSAIAISPETTLLVSAGAGVTDDAPDFSFTVSVPIAYDLFD